MIIYIDSEKDSYLHQLYNLLPSPHRRCRAFQTVAAIWEDRNGDQLNLGYV